MKPVKILCVFGTRPEAVKMCPLVRALRSRPEFDCLVCVTGQHREMLDQVLEAFDVTPDYDLNIMEPGQTLSALTARILRELDIIMEKSAPGMVLVHGDTTTTFAAAISAFYRKIKVGHVEAGLRTADKYSPYPEEMNRLLTARIADLHFAPTPSNADNLTREGVTQGVYVTGNTAIDALRKTVSPDYTFQQPLLNTLDMSAERAIVATIHRRENLGKPMHQIFTALRELADRYSDIRILYPVHKNPLVRQAARLLENHPRICLLEPLSVTDMHNLMARCYMAVTDSGGLQEEAPALGKPVLVLRTETERPEAVEAGTVLVTGVDTAQIVRQASLLLDDPDCYSRMAKATNPYGDGTASEQICGILAEYFRHHGD